MLIVGEHNQVNLNLLGSRSGVYLRYDEDKMSLVKLNGLRRFIRWIGGYTSTHLKTVVQGLHSLEGYAIFSRLVLKLQYTWNRIFQDEIYPHKDKVQLTTCPLTEQMMIKHIPFTIEVGPESGLAAWMELPDELDEKRLTEISSETRHLEFTSLIFERKADQYNAMIQRNIHVIENYVHNNSKRVDSVKILFPEDMSEKLISTIQACRSMSHPYARIIVV